MANQLIVATIIGSNILDIPTAIKIISSSVTTIYGIVDSVTKSKSMHLTDLNEFLIKCDLKANLNVYTSLIKELGETNSETVTLCIHNIQDTIKALELEMLDINRKTKYNDSLYFGVSWRSYSFHNNIKRLSDFIDILDKRIKNLKLCGNMISKNVVMSMAIPVGSKKQKCIDSFIYDGNYSKSL